MNDPQPIPMPATAADKVTGLGRFMGDAAKALTHLLVVALGGLVAAYSDGSVTGPEWCVLVVSPALGAVLVYVTPIAKGLAALVSAGTAAVAQLAVALADGDGISQPELVAIVLVTAVALERVYDTPATEVSDELTRTAA